MISLTARISIERTYTGKFAIKNIEFIEFYGQYSEIVTPTDLDLRVRFDSSAEAEDHARNFLIQFASAKYPTTTEIVWDARTIEPTWTAYYTDDNGNEKRYEHMIIRKMDDEYLILQSTFDDHTEFIQLPRNNVRLVEEG